MTATSHLSLDASGHPDIETLSEYVEDLLAPQVAAELTAHLAGCADCRESRDALDEIRSLLGQAEVPPIPDDIALRIDAALAAEAADAQQATGTASKAASAPRAAVERDSGRPTARTSLSGPQGPSSPTRPTGEGPGRRTARRLRRAALGVAALTACGLIVTAALHIHGGDSSGTASSSSRSSGFGREAGSQFTVFSRTGFAGQVQMLLSAQPSGADQPQAQSGVQRSSSASAKADNRAVPSCVLAAVSRPGQQPLAVEQGSYQGIAVYALVYPDSADPAHAVDAFLVDAGCTTPVGHITPVLLSDTVARP